MVMYYNSQKREIYIAKPLRMEARFVRLVGGDHPCQDSELPYHLSRGAWVDDQNGTYCWKNSSEDPSKMAILRTQNPAIQVRSPFHWRVQEFLGLMYKHLVNSELNKLPSLTGLPDSWSIHSTVKHEVLLQHGCCFNHRPLFIGHD